MDKIEQIYTYVKGRSDGKIHPGRPQSARRDEGRRVLLLVLSVALVLVPVEGGTGSEGGQSSVLRVRGLAAVQRPLCPVPWSGRAGKSRRGGPAQDNCAGRIFGVSKGVRGH